MNKPFKISAFLLAVCIALAPYTSLISHAVSHLFVSDHHVHAAQTPPVQHHDHDEDHPAVTIDSLTLGPIVSSLKLSPPTSQAWGELVEGRKAVIFKYHAVAADSLPPLIEASLFLSLHSANAPPL